MAKTYAELLQDVKAQVRQVSLEDLHARREAGEPLVIVDVRDKDVKNMEVIELGKRGAISEL